MHQVSLVKMWVLSWAFNAFLTSVCEEHSKNPDKKRIRWRLLIHRKSVSLCGNSWQNFKRMVGKLLHFEAWTSDLFPDQDLCNFRHIIVHRDFFHVYSKSGSAQHPVLFLSYFLGLTALLFSFWLQLDLVLFFETFFL